MAKISRHFRLDQEVNLQLKKIAAVTSEMAAISLEGLSVAKKVTDTDVVTYLIQQEYERLKLEFPHYFKEEG
jgi:hypothetical protein